MNNPFEFLLNRCGVITQYVDTVTEILIRNELSTKFGYTYYRLRVNVYFSNRVETDYEDTYVSIRIYDELNIDQIEWAEYMCNDLVFTLKQHLGYLNNEDNVLLSKIKDERTNLIIQAMNRKKEYDSYKIQR
jgi:hypothetical protein